MFSGSNYDYDTPTTIYMNGGIVAVGGRTESWDFPLINSIQVPTNSNFSNGFIYGYFPGQGVSISSLIGGSGQDEIVDVTSTYGDIIFLGGTNSSDLPISGKILEVYLGNKN